MVHMILILMSHYKILLFLLVKNDHLMIFYIIFLFYKSYNFIIPFYKPIAIKFLYTSNAVILIPFITFIISYFSKFSLKI